MSKLNKIITNQPVVLTEEEVNNLSETLSAVRTAGGGEGGHLYTGDNKYIGVDNGNYKIKFLDNASEKLESISSKLDKTEAANTYLTSADAQTLYQTKEAMSAYSTTEATTAYVNGVTGSIYYTSILGLVDALSAKQDKLTFGYDENDAISSINSHKLAGAGGVTGDYYSASNPSGFINSAQAETQILEKHYLTEASGNARYIPIPEGLSDGQYYAYTTSSWKVIQGAGDVSGISTVAHDDTLTGNGNNENLGVDITKIQTKLTDAQIQNITDVTTLKTASSTWDNVSAKLNTTDFNTYTATTAPSTYQPIGNYLSSNALEGYATQDWVNEQGYIKQETDWTNTIQEASAKAYNDATANANSLYQTKGDYVKNTDIGLDANNKVTAISGKELIITAHQSLTNYYTKDETSGATQLSTEFGKYLTKTIADGYYYPLSTNPSNYATSAGLTQSKQYAMTTTGWSEITGGGSTFTGVTTASPITGDGLNNTLGLDSNYKTAIEQVSGKVDKPADMTSNIPYCFSAGQWADITQTYYSKTEATGTFLQKHLTNTLSGDGTTNNTLGVNWSNLSSNLINSANTASNAWISGTEFSSFAQIKTAIDSKQSAGDYVHISGDTMTGGLTISAATGNNILTVTSAATQLGASRQTESNFGQNNNAMGTNWIGVDASNRGFFKFVQGGSVGDLNGNSLQMSFSPNTGNGEIVAKCSQNGDRDSVIVNVEQSGYNSMETFDPVNGPNYMLRKTANGFAIGAKVVNVTTLPGTTDANTYYFVYEV